MKLSMEWVMAAMLAVAASSAGAVTLPFSSYMGGGSLDEIHAVATDSEGNTYVAGETASLSFPLTNGFDNTLNGMDVFVAKIGTNGQIVFSTLLGGSGGDAAFGIAVDRASNVYVTGYAESGSDFPVTNEFQAAPGDAGPHGFVAKIGNQGTNLIYSSYLSGPTGGNNEEGRAIAVDASGCAYITGHTSSTNLHLVNPIQSVLNANSGAFVMKIHPAGTGVVFSTYLGGTDASDGYGIAVDASSNVYVVGFCNEEFLVTNALYPAPLGGSSDGFVTKIAPAGTSLLWSTYYGGSSDDYLTSVAVSPDGDVYFAGYGQSFDLPLTNAIQTEFGGYTWDAYIAAIRPLGDRLTLSTFYGGNNSDGALALAVDRAGNILVAGITLSPDLPTIGGRPSGGFNDAFVLKLLAGGKRILFSTYLGGDATDEANGVAVQRNGIVHVAGLTLSTNYPIANAFQPENASPGSDEGFITRIANEPVMLVASNSPAGFVGGWNTYSGAVYQAQTSTNLVNGPWTDLGGPGTSLVNGCCMTATQAPPVSPGFLRAKATFIGP